MTTTPEKVFTAPDEMRDRLNDNETDPVFSRAVLRYIEKLERGYRAACGVADGYKDDFHKAADLAQSCASVKPLEWMYPEHHKDFEYVETVVGRYQVRETFYEGKGYLSLPKEHGYHKAGNTLEEAKSAAQADYERRITEALSIRTEAEVRKEWQSELPDYIDLYRIIKRSGARKHGDIAKAIAQAITSLIEGEADD